jgi:hypothetical protein
MAEAYGKVTGKPGVLLVTRGPGACNASIGVHTAHQDSTPMVVLVGQVARHQIDREAFQEVDFREMYAPLAKWVTQIDMAERIPELLNQAFQVATSGRPGPVVVALPEDMLRDRAAAAIAGPYRAVRAHPGAADLAEMRRLLAAAHRPMMLVGGSEWSDAAAADIARFAMANDLPVCCSFRRQDIVDNRLPCFVGDLGTGAAPTLVARVKSADLVLAVGARIGEITSQSYTLMGIPDPGADRENQIGGFYPHDEGWRGPGSEIADKALQKIVDDVLTAERAAHRQIVRHREIGNVGGGLIVPSAAADQHDRPRGTGEQMMHFGEVGSAGMRPHGAVRTDGRGGGALAQHILGQGDDDRAGAARGRNLECLVQQFGDALGHVDLRHPLGERRVHLAEIDFLERLAVDLVARHLADQHDHRGRILMRGMDAD